MNNMNASRNSLLNKQHKDTNIQTFLDAVPHLFHISNALRLDLSKRFGVTDKKLSFLIDRSARRGRNCK
jgi:hypothetical protein